MIGFKLSGEELGKLSALSLPDGLALKPIDPEDERFVFSAFSAHPKRVDGSTIRSWTAVLDMRAKLHADELGDGRPIPLGKEEWKRDLQKGLCSVSSLTNEINSFYKIFMNKKLN